MKKQNICIIIMLVSIANLEVTLQERALKSNKRVKMVSLSSIPKPVLADISGKERFFMELYKLERKQLLLYIIYTPK